MVAEVHPYVARAEQAVREMGVCEGCPAVTPCFTEVESLVDEDLAEQCQSDEELDAKYRDTVEFNFIRNVSPDITAREAGLRFRNTRVLLAIARLDPLKKALDATPCLGGITPARANQLHPYPIEMTEEQHAELVQQADKLRALLGITKQEVEMPRTRSGRVCEVEVRNLREWQARFFDQEE